MNAGVSMHTVELSGEDMAMLVEALDDHEYWGIAEHGRVLPVGDAAVWLPGDYLDGAEADPYWPDGANQAPPGTLAAVESARRCRALADELRTCLPDVSER